MLCGVAEILSGYWCIQHACMCVERSSFIMIFGLLLSVVSKAYFNDDTRVVFVGVIATLFL